MGKSTISMAIFNSYVKIPERKRLLEKTQHPIIGVLSLGISNMILERINNPTKREN